MALRPLGGRTQACVGRRLFGCRQVVVVTMRQAEDARRSLPEGGRPPAPAGVCDGLSSSAGRIRGSLHRDTRLIGPIRRRSRQRCLSRIASSHAPMSAEYQSEIGR
jgi:hypothetical protein